MMDCAYRWCEVEETYVAARDDVPATLAVHRAHLVTIRTDCGRVLSMSVIASDIQPNPHILIEDVTGDGTPELLFAVSYEAARRVARGALEGVEAIVHNAMTRTQHERAHNKRAVAERDLAVPPPRRYLRVLGGDGDRRARPKAAEQ